MPDKNIPWSIIVLLLIILFISACDSMGFDRNNNNLSQDLSVNENMTTRLVHENDSIQLPEPNLQGEMSLEQALVNRRSVRDFADIALTDVQIGQLLWAAQGMTHPNGYRTAPSAGALYPLEVYAATREGFFHYKPQDHRLEMILDIDPRPGLYQAALEQDPLLEAPLVILITAVYERTEQKYGQERSPRYVHLEAGHAAQNILLQATALSLGAVPIGAFYDQQIKETLSLPNDQMPLYLIPIGYPK